jgi:hypothetical protein
LRHDASCRVHRYATIISASYFNFAGVEARAQWQTYMFGGCAKCQGTSNRTAGSVECRQNSVAGCFDQTSRCCSTNLAAIS